MNTLVEKNNRPKLKMRRMTLFAMLLAIELLLIFTPLGFVPVGPIKATTLHIPVIVAGILLGPLEGAGLGLVFGLASLITNTVAPTVTSFVFSPFYSVGEFHGNIWSVWIAIGPRILLGVLPFIFFQFFNKFIKMKSVSAGISAALSTFSHTLLVMGSIYLFFGRQYAEARGIAQSALLGVIGGVIAVNGVAELIIAAIIVAAVYKVNAKISS